MLITESELRKIIRGEIIKESFLSTAEEGIKSVQINNKNYAAMGFTKAQEKFYLVIHAPKTDEQKIKKVGGQMIKRKEVKLQNSETSSQTHTQKNFGFGNSKVKNIFYAIPTKSDQIKYTKEVLKTGASSDADYAIEIGGILGAIPGLGNFVDIGTMFVAIIKDPPDYLMGAFSFICALPAIGVGAAFARAAVKKAGKEGAKNVAKQLSKELKDQGVTLTRTKLTAFKQKISGIWASVTSKERIEMISRVTNVKADEIISRLGETKKYVDEIVDNIEVVGKSSKGIDDFSKAVVKRTSAKLLTEITSGQIRNVCVKWAKELAEQLPKQYPGGPKDFIGKSFNHPETGKAIVFKSFPEFKDQFLKMSELIGSDKGEDFFMKYYADMYEVPMPVQPKNVEAVTDMLMEKMSKIKIKIVTDTSTAAREFGETTRGKLRLKDPPEVLINFNKFVKDGLEKNVQETMEHELIHGIDKLLLTVLAGGDDLAQELIRSKGLRLASDLTATSGVLKGAQGGDLAEYIFNKSKIENILKAGDENLTGLTNWQFYLARRGGFSAGDIAYVSDPAEMFVRVQRISYWLKANGFKPNQWEEFFRRSKDDMLDEVPDADFFEPFFPLFKEIASDPANASAFKKQLEKDIYSMFNALI